jgi:hypothetical protein
VKSVDDATSARERGTGEERYAGRPLPDRGQAAGTSAAIVGLTGCLGS